MNRYIVIHEDATLDLQEHFNYLAQNSKDNAFLFFESARQTFAALARMPAMGRQYESEEEDILNIRKWAVKGFKNYSYSHLCQDRNPEKRVAALPKKPLAAYR